MEDLMKQFRRAFRQRFLYDEVGREKGFLLLMGIVWFFLLCMTLAFGGILWRGEGRDSSENFQVFLFSAVLCAGIYWLCFAKDKEDE